ncbi:hypothetical protein D9M71_526760 [compost metagenome]
MEIRRRVVDQRLYQGVDRRAADVVKIIDHQVLLGAVAIKRVDQGRADRLEPTGVAMIGQRQVVLQRYAHLLQGADKARTEGFRGVVLGIEREPGHQGAFLEQFKSPLGQQGGLAESGAAGNQHQAMVAGIVQASHQRFAQHGVA